MNGKESLKVVKEMEKAGFDVHGRMRWESGSYSVDATDRATGIRIRIDSVEQWNERKAAVTP